MEPSAGGRRKLSAILSADAVGYSRLMGADERATVETLKTYRAAIGAVVARHHGRVVNTPGDSILAEFPSAVEAVQAGVEIQRNVQGRNTELSPERRMEFRIGVNLGDVIEEVDGTLYGDGVNVAARLEALADAGGICVSGKVFEEVESKLDFGFDFAGEQEVKNIAKPVRIYRVRPEGQGNRSGTTARPARAGRRVGLIAAGIAVVLVAAGLAGWQAMRARQPAADPVLALPSGPSIAVLPFANLSGDPKQDYFADGITEQIITELSRFRNLFVIAHNSTLRYKGQAVDVRQVGRELGAKYVLEGSVRRAATTVRVTAQLLDARNGTHLWADNYERDLSATNILDVQDEIGARVVAAIADTHGVILRATFGQIKARGTKSFDAYDCVLRAYAYERIMTPDEHQRVRECLEQAVKLDPNYAEAWAALATAYRREHSNGFNPRPNPLDRALETAQRAVGLDPANQAAHIALATTHFFRHDIDAFSVEAERAVALNPNNADALAFAGHFTTLAYIADVPKRERGVAMMKKAIALSPLHPGWYYFTFALNHYWKGEYEQALAYTQKINMPGFFWTHAMLGIIYGALGRRVDAQPALANLLKLYPDFPKNIRQEYRKWNTPDDIIDRYISDLRKAGLDIPPNT